MLRCPACGSEYEDRWRCTCTHQLDFANPPRPAPYAPDARSGLWAFAPFLPVENRVSLGEGYTPLTDAPHWNAQFKLEYVFPSGSFKDRGATLTLSRALDVGAERVVEDSSGNAGAAIATYAARAGLDCEIYVPASVKASKLRAIERAGADVVRVEGSRQAVTDACVEAVESGAGWYASHAWNPAFFAGTATFAYELAHQRDWEVPDAVVCPVGHGTLFLGAYRGFRALREAGWTDSVPRLLGVQAAGYDPIAREFESKGRGSGDGDVASGDGTDSGESNDIADGIQILDPARGDQIRAAIEATDGDCISVDAAATERELDALHERGFYTEPTCAVAPAGLREYRERGVLDEASDVVIPLTGSGLKG
ncbi:pyridoxal-phosphate dependent enzyme [Halomarina salina]|uniref:Pyridoxal-phosphate dependent enzyme n=1 Tax=Halomarina salina TaxID=1872699 RepID=A0ABD5RL71_9EURY|nr:pyridoxal-phosphate dependent enzyme [Halomarina salina]